MNRREKPERGLDEGEMELRSGSVHITFCGPETWLSCVCVCVCEERLGGVKWDLLFSLCGGGYLMFLTGWWRFRGGFLRLSLPIFCFNVSFVC